MSATNEFAKLDFRQPIARAEINKVGAGWDIPVGTTVRDDRTTHLPLTMPGGLQPQPLEPPPPPPTEAELRATLAQANAAWAFADEGLQRAKASADRAAQHVAQCKAHAATFDDLDDQITERTVEALRSGDGRPRGGMDDDLRQRVAERDVARASAVAAERAQPVLDAAALEAGVGADLALKAARSAAVAVMAGEAERLAQRVVDLEDEAERTRDALIAFDRVSASTEQPLPAAVFAVVVADSARLSKPVDSRAWEAALDQLLGDAQAEVSVTIPPRQPPPPGVALQPRHHLRGADQQARAGAGAGGVDNAVT